MVDTGTLETIWRQWRPWRKLMKITIEPCADLDEAVAFIVNKTLTNSTTSCSRYTY